VFVCVFVFVCVCVCVICDRWSTGQAVGCVCVCVICDRWSTGQAVGCVCVFCDMALPTISPRFFHYLTTLYYIPML